MSDEDVPEKGAKKPVKTRSTSDTTTAKKPRKGQENLIPLNQRTKDEQRKIQVKGGKASAKVRQDRKLLREKLAIAMTMPLRDGEVVPIENVKSFEEAKEANLTLEDRMMMQIARRAANGDPQIYQLYRDEMGQKIPEKVIVSGEIDITTASLDDLIKLAHDMQRSGAKRK